VNTFPKILKDAVSEQRIDVSHGLLLTQAVEQHGDKVELKTWVKQIESEGLSVRQLTRALNAELGKPKKKTRYLERKGGGFRLFPMRFDPKTTDEGAKARMLEKLKEAVAMLEGKAARQADSPDGKPESA
jgi:hypothetical protein